MITARVVVATAMLALSAQAAEAQIFGQARTGAQRSQDRQIAQVPRCERPIGTLAIADGDGAAYDAMELQPPQTLLRVVVQRSGCFTLVDRGSVTLDAIERERRLASAGSLQHGSNLGAGQMRAADFILLAEVASENDDAAGAGASGQARSGGGAGGRLLRGALGAGAMLATGSLPLSGRGGIDSRTAEANTVLSIVNVRTTETIAVSQGYAAKRDVNWNIAAAVDFGGFVGGGYENTEIGRIVAQAFINAYSDIVGQLGRMDLGIAPADSAPIANAAIATQAAPPAPPFASSSSIASGPVGRMTLVQSTTLREAPNGAVVGVLRNGQTVHPTGEQDGEWVEIIDEADALGWVQQDRLTPAQ